MTKPSDRQNGGRWLVNAAKQTQYSHHSDDVTCRGAPMKFIPGRFRAGAWLCACVASAVLVGAALAQPPKPGGAGGGGGPGGGAPGPGGGWSWWRPRRSGPRWRRSRHGSVADVHAALLQQGERRPGHICHDGVRPRTTIPRPGLDASAGWPVCAGRSVPASRRVLAWAVAGGNGLGQPQSKPGSVRQPGSRVRLHMGWLGALVSTGRDSRAVHEDRGPAQRRHLRYDAELGQRQA